MWSRPRTHHSLQLQLLLHALELLQPSGRLVYSTCSLNPIECEAVVQAALQRGHVLVPAEEALPAGCPRGSKGLVTWSVPEPSFVETGNVHESSCGGGIGA